MIPGERVDAAHRAVYERSDRRFKISVAADLAAVHPQTLRIYEEYGLIAPERSPKQTRLYSLRDVERARRIRGLTVRTGMTLAGVKALLEVEKELERVRAELAELRRSSAPSYEVVPYDRVSRDLVPYASFPRLPMAFRPLGYGS